MDVLTILYQLVDDNALIELMKGGGCNSETGYNAFLARNDIGLGELFFWNGAQRCDIVICPVLIKGLSNYINRWLTHE
jgi:hypothetical protein